MERFMRRIALVAGLVLVVGACGGGSTESETTVAPDTSPASTATTATNAPATSAATTTTAAAGPDSDGDGVADAADEDDDNDGVPDTEDDFPMDANRSVALQSLFPVVDGIAQLPDEPSVTALRWFQEAVAAGGIDESTLEEVFAPSFLSQFSTAQINDLIAGVSASHGGVFEPLDVRLLSKWTLWINMGNPDERASTTLTRLVLDPNTNLVTLASLQPSRLGLTAWIYPDDQSLDMEATVAEIGTLAPSTSVLVAEITEDGCSVIAGFNETERRGIASMFKTWVLAAVAAEVEAGRVSPDDIVTFTPGEYMVSGSTATGAFTSAMDLSVQDAANLMMNISDNGATDILHALVGRDAVDAFVSQSGHTTPEALTPLLTVSEFGHLYGSLTASQVDEWLTGDEAAQSAFAEEELAARGPFITGTTGNPPVARLSWQASPIDVCETYATMRAQFPPGSAGAAFIDEAFGGEGLLFGTRNSWDRIWYKGGGHPGFSANSSQVRTDGMMVESNNGRAFAIVAMYNSDEDIPNDPFVFLNNSLLSRVLQLLVSSS